MKKVFLLIIGVLSIHTSFSQNAGIKLKNNTLVWKPYSNIYVKSDKWQTKPMVTENKKSFAFNSPYKYTDQLGFVCKWELKLDVKTINPIRFRLGSYEYVNKLEGK